MFAALRPEDDAAREMALRTKQTLQLMQVAMKAHAVWAHKSDFDSGVAKFDSHWRQLEQFMRDESGNERLRLECPYIWHIYYEVMAVKPDGRSFPAELIGHVLRDRLLLASDDVVADMQRSLLRMMLNHIMSSSLSLEKSTERLADRLRPFFDDPAATRFLDAEVFQELTAVRLVALAGADTNCREAVANLRGGFGLLESGEPTTTLVGEFLSCRALGTQFIERARSVLSSRQKCFGMASKLEEHTEKLSELVEASTTTPVLASWAWLAELDSWFAAVESPDAAWLGEHCYDTLSAWSEALTAAASLLAAELIATWAIRYSDSANWAAPVRDDDAQCLQAMQAVRSLRCLELAPTTTSAVALCREWYAAHSTIAGAVADPGSVAQAVKVQPCRLSALAPVHEWRQALESTCTHPSTADRCTALWVQVNDKIGRVSSNFTQLLGCKFSEDRVAEWPTPRPPPSHQLAVRSHAHSSVTGCGAVVVVQLSFLPSPSCLAPGPSPRCGGAAAGRRGGFQTLPSLGGPAGLHQGGYRRCRD